MGNNNIFQMSQELRQQINWINAILLGDKNSTVNINGVVKPSISKDIDMHWSELRSMVQGRLTFETFSLLQSSGSPSQAVLAEVWNDSTDDKNGVYGWNGSQWIKSPYDSYRHVLSIIDVLTIDLSDLTQEQYRQWFKNGISGGSNKSIDVTFRGGLNPDDQIISATTDEDGHMLEGYNNAGEKIQATPLRCLADVLLAFAAINSGEYNYAFSVPDENNNVSFGVDKDGNTLANTLLLFQSLLMPGGDIDSGEYNYDFAIADEDGSVIFGIQNGKVVLALSDTTSRSGDAINLSRSIIEQHQLNTTSCRNYFDLNHLITYGQSLSTGQEGWPRLSKTAFYGNVMIGKSVRPQPKSSDYYPIGSVDFMPLVASVSSGNGVLSDSDVALLPVGSQNSGETPSEGWANMAKRLHNQHYCQLNDPRTFIASNNGWGGLKISELSKGHSNGVYARNIACIRTAKRLAEEQNKTYGVTGLLWMQGEYDYLSDKNGDYTRDDYYAALSKLRNDLLTDIRAITGQNDDPAFFVYQPGPGYVRDDHDLGVGMALWDMTLHDNCFLVGPVYPVTDKGGHLDSNGYRWYGNQVAKVYHHVVTLGRQWKPLSPTNVALLDDRILIDYHVPQPPIQFINPYARNSIKKCPNFGFYVTDEAGSVPISSVKIVSQTQIEIKLYRQPVGNGQLWYANQRDNGGYGHVCDSDTTLAHDHYEYELNAGFYPSANIPELVGKPYPLNNWSISFCLPLNWSC